MKLLFDENLAQRLAHDIADVFPGSAHALTLGLGGASDRDIWTRAAAEDFVVVTKDGDFHRLSVLLGPPPKVTEIREHAARELERLPEPFRRLDPVASYPVRVAEPLVLLAAEVDRRKKNI